MNFKDKFECYEYYKSLIENAGAEVEPYREINYGLQFKVIISGDVQTVRIYESAKRGVRPDFSPVKNAGLLALLNGETDVPPNDAKISGAKRSLSSLEENLADIEENSLIGTDESGKGDYFGPLVVAGVYADERAKKILSAIGVDDSKKLKDSQIAVMASQIKEVCQYDIVSIGNSKYNELYGRIDNLNKLLAWGHARVVENLLEKVDCGIVLSDQFGSPELIANALMKKGKSVHLEQRPRAEENIVVAAASILARNEFVERMDAMSKAYGIEFPKGASKKTIIAGKQFIDKFGSDRLSEVAKLHFKTTGSIVGE